MKYQFLGTAAAEGWPAIFCGCDNCKRAKNAGGRNIRTRSQAVIDDKLLIDFPADTYMHVLQHGLDLTKVFHCIITHDHSDHLYPADFGMRRKGFAHLPVDVPLNIYGTVPTGLKVTGTIKACDLDDQNCVKFHLISAFEPFTVDNYVVTPLKADHGRFCEPVFYAITDGEKSILNANDTGYFPDSTWAYLETHKPYFSLVTLDCTLGTEKCRYNHMDLETNIEVKERLIQMGCADQNTVFVANHFSHNGQTIYDELVPIAAKHGLLVSYDGMMIEI